MEIIKKIKEEFYNRIENVSNMQQIQEVQISFLGKKGYLTESMKKLKDLSKEEKIIMGKNLNILKQEIVEKLAEVESKFKDAELEEKLKQEYIDVTQHGLFFESGYIHPLTSMTLEISAIFKSMGFDVLSGPEVETDEFNFEMLNIPKNHSARDMQDTFYINDSLLLRTHTSPVQVRTMSANEDKGPIRILSPGKVYRRDEDDATHSHQFMQIEGLLVDKDISLGNLIGTLKVLVNSIFGEDRNIRVRPSYFPFTEPSIEIDVDCFNCNGSGCGVCKNTGWIEVLGAGMIHPEVLSLSGYDPEVYNGFAFGLGVERFVMLKYKVKDIRDLYTNNIKFIKNMNSKVWGNM